MSELTSERLGSSLEKDIHRWRADTPGCDLRVHLNNAGAALMPKCVIAAMIHHLELEQTLGGYEAAEASVAEIRDAYAAIARLLGTEPHNIAIVENATVAVAQALSAQDFRPGDILVTSRVDYPSNQLMYLSLAQRLGIQIVRAADLPEGGVDPESVRRILRQDRCRLVCISWVPTNSGLVQMVREVGSVCAEAGVPYMVDACQAVGQLPVNVESLNCDYLAGTGRKFVRGPRGVGFLYVSDRALDRSDAPLYIDMRGADWIGPDQYVLSKGARRFENWEFAYALVLGLGAATQYANEVGPTGHERARKLAQYARKLLAAENGVRVLDCGSSLCAIATAAFAGRDAAEIKLALRERGVNTSSSAREDGLIDMDAKKTSSVLRISPHYYNTETEVEHFVRELHEILQ